jgi:peptidyl-prolyl cis-trans isomerase SurA
MQAHRRSSVLQAMRINTAKVKRDEHKRVCPPGRRTGATMSAVAAAAFLLTAIPSGAHAQQVLAVVNGTPITSYDVDQRTQLARIAGGKVPGRKEILEELINEKVKLLEAKRYSIEASKSEIEGAYANMASRMGMKPDQLTKALGGRGIKAETLKKRISADIAWGHLVRGRYQATLEVGAGDIRAVLGPKPSDDKGAIGHVYRLRPILFIVPQGSPASRFEARRREADALRKRFNDCRQGVALARQMRDVAVRDTIIRNSASLPGALRTMLNSLELGKLTSPELTSQGIEVFALCGKEETRAETPRQQEAKQEIYGKRFDAQSKRYLDRVRRSSMIEYK